MAVYTPKVDEAIWGLACSGWKPRQIRHALENDEELFSDLGGPIKMPPRTLSEKLRRLREERGEPKPPAIAPGEERAVIADLRQQMLARMRVELEKLTEKDDPEVEDIRKISAIVKLVDAIDVGIRESQRIKDPQRQDAALARHHGPSKDLLKSIVDAESARSLD